MANILDARYRGGALDQALRGSAIRGMTEVSG